MRTRRIYKERAVNPYSGREIAPFELSFQPSHSPSCTTARSRSSPGSPKSWASMTATAPVPILLARLRDLGFVAGARCEVLARMWSAAIRSSCASAVPPSRCVARKRPRCGSRASDRDARDRGQGRKRRTRLSLPGESITASWTSPTQSLRIALVGVPNCGKTALFNRLTGSRQKVANYAGVTVERREGERVAADGRACACSTCLAPTA